MPESPSKGSKPVLKSRYNALSSHSTVPSSRPSTVPANDHEAVAPLLIEKGANREGKDSRDRTTRATIEQPSRNPSSTIRKVIPFAIILLSSFAQVLCAIVIGQYDALHTRSGLSAPLNLIGILCWQKSALSDSTCLFGLHLPDFVIDPSEFIFAIAVMVYGLAMLIFYDTRKGDRHQDHFLASGAFLGLLAGLALSIRKGTMGPYRGCIPISITIALLLSVAAHSISRKLIPSSKLHTRESIRGL